MLAIFNTAKLRIRVFGNTVNLEGFLLPIYYSLYRKDLLEYLRSLEGRSIFHTPGLAEDVNVDDLFNELFDDNRFNGFNDYLMAITYGDG